MLYTQSQLVSYAAFCLKHYKVKDEQGEHITPSHALRSNWEEENSIQPLQIGQEFTLTLLDGITLTAEITSITEQTNNDVTQPTL